MTRLERKCFIASAALHGLLLVTFLFGSAFFTSKPKTMQAIEVVDLSGKVTDKMISTGGSPQGNPTPPPPAPATPPAAPPTPPVEPPKVEPPPPQVKKEVVKPKPVEPKKEVVKDKGEMPTKKVVKKTPEKPKEVAENTKPVRTISTNVVRRSNSAVIAAQVAAQKRAAQQKAQREYERQYAEYQRELQALNSQINGVIGGVGKSLGNKTVALPLGDGGAAYVHYGSLIGELYKRAVYASRPEGDDDAIAVIRIVVRRNGVVTDADWVRKTGDSVLDKAVDRAMKTVRNLPAFPEGSSDNERTFTINIGFEAKRVSA